jgi:hypothetical protein
MRLWVNSVGGKGIVEYQPTATQESPDVHATDGIPANPDVSSASDGRGSGLEVKLPSDRVSTRPSLGLPVAENPPKTTHDVADPHPRDSKFGLVPSVGTDASIDVQCLSFSVSTNASFADVVVV